MNHLRGFGKRKNDEDTRPKVVILGAGIGGASVLSNIISRTSKLNLIVIESREAAVWKPAGTRAAVEGPDFAHKACVTLENLVPRKKGVLINSKVANVGYDDLTLSDGQKLQFDYLVCATGAANISPCEPPSHLSSIPDLKSHYFNIHSMLEMSQNILLLGGGAVAVEFAGEIRSKYRKKNITILAPQQRLLEGCRPAPSERFYDKLEAAVRKKNIKILCDQTAMNLSMADFKGTTFLLGPRIVMASGGEQIQTDLVFLCIGRRLNNTIYPNQWKGSSGALKVRPTLQLTTRDNIFAVGDINDVNENKQGYLAEKQAKVVADNIILLSKGKYKLKKYAPLDRTEILVPLGRSTGVSYFSNRVWGGAFTKRIKGNDLFVGRTWSIYNGTKALKEQNKLVKNYGGSFTAASSFSAINDSISQNDSQLAYDNKMLMMPNADNASEMFEANDPEQEFEGASVLGVPRDTPQVARKKKKKKGPLQQLP